MKSRKIRIGTRGSKLAMWQANWAKQALLAAPVRTEVEIKVLKTTGDAVRDVALSNLPGKAFFTKEIEDALQRGEIDLAVHSGKDVPTDMPSGLVLAGFSKRHAPSDVVVSKTGKHLSDLPIAARIGTSSIRRKALVAHYRSDLNIVDLRGNVDTRLAKLDAGEYDAILLAQAGIERLGLGHRITQFLDTRRFPPAVSQGAVALQIREDDTQLRSAIDPLLDPTTGIALTAERALLAELEGGCQVPLGALATLDGDHLKMVATLVAPDGSARIDDSIEAPIQNAAEAGRSLAKKLLDKGGWKILELVRGENGRHGKVDANNSGGPR